jgi:Tfp pilus assembly protein PilF
MGKRARLRKIRGQNRREVAVGNAIPSAVASHQTWQIVTVCIVLAVVTFLAFQGVRNSDFVDFDDHGYVLENRHVQQGLNAQSIEWAFTTFEVSNWHPLTWISHMVDWSIYGNNPSGHHITNLLLHAANAVLLFLLLLYLTGSLWRSAIVAFLFALHPAHVESVAWISERKDVLCAFFWFLTSIAYVWNVRKPSWKRFVWVVCGCACALLSKPMAVTLPFTLVLLDFWPLRRITFSPETRGPWFSTLRTRCLEKWPLFMMAAISSVITFKAQQASGAVATFQGLPLADRICNAAISYWRYVRIMIWPDPLTPYYYYDASHTMVAGAVLSAVAILLVTGACWRFRNDRPYCLVGWLWFLGTLLPVIGLVQVGGQSLAERYTYIPYIGLFIAVVWLAGDVLARFPKFKVAAWLLTGAVIVACAVKTDAQVRIWKDTVTLFSHVLAIDPRGEITNSTLGIAYMRLGMLDEAQKYIEQSLVYDPDNFDGHNDLGIILGRKGRMQEALKEFRRSAAINSNRAKAHANIAWILTATNQLSEAIPEFTQALQLDPDQADVHNNFGVALLGLGANDKAYEQFSDALQIQPDYADAKKNLALAQAGMKNANGQRTGK